MNPEDSDAGTYETRLAHTKSLLEEYSGTRETICLSFSGGKESVVLAHMLRPWRERTWLVWAKTPLMAPHMEEFVGSYREDFRVVEVPTMDPRRLWETYGTPSRVTAGSWKSLDAPTMLNIVCCYNVISTALFDFYGSEVEPLRVMGKRAEDGSLHPVLEREVTFIKVGEHQTGEECVDARAGIELQPLWAWTQDDVFRYVRENNLKLPMQYAEGCIDSLECLSCPGKLYPERLAFLKKHYPQEAAEAVNMAMGNLRFVYEALEPIRAALENEVWIKPF